MKVRKKVLWMLALAAALTLPLSAAAERSLAGGLDAGRACRLTVNVTGAETDAVEELQLSQMPNEEIVIDLYKVADIEPDQDHDDYRYGSFGIFEADGEEPLRTQANELLGLRLEQKDAGERWDALAQELARTILSNPDLVCTESGIANTPMDLEGPGLYLVLVRGADLSRKEDYFKVEAMQGGAQGETHIVTRVCSAGYEYTFTPALVSLPEHLENEAEGGYEWIYDVTLSPKHGTGYRLGSLRIEKELLSYVESTGGKPASPATFVFKIDCSYIDQENRIGGEFEYHDVVSMNFGGYGTQSIVIENTFPVGAEVTVEEIYSGASYGIVGESRKTVPIEAGEEAEVTVRFLNDYNHSGNGGGAVENSFELVVDAAGRPVTDAEGRLQWTWKQRKADSGGIVQEDAALVPMDEAEN